MNNIWHPCYKKLEKVKSLNINSFEYNLKYDRIKLFIQSDYHNEYYLYAEWITYYGFTSKDALKIVPFEVSDEIEEKDRPFHFFYEVKNSLLIDELVKNSGEGLWGLSKGSLRHFLVRLGTGVFNIVTESNDVRIVEIKHEF